MGLLQGSVLDLNAIRKLCAQGIPDSLRPTFWKILLNYLPLRLADWDEVLASRRTQYREFVQELLSKPQQQAPCAARETPVSEEEDPLSVQSNSRWNVYFKDRDMQTEIDKDVKRTFPHLHFFNNDGEPGETLHHRALSRILFIYAKLNPGIAYVQGMNEVLGPIYYVFASASPAPEDRDNAEADAFYCFTSLMSEIMNNFCKTLDSSEMGIKATMLRLNAMLRHYDAELWQDMEHKGLDPHFYSFRWITLLLSQEFELPDVIRLWDSLFADASRFDFLLRVCCAMIISIRATIFNGDFASNLKTLQAYPSSDIIALIRTAQRLDERLLARSQPPPQPPATDSPLSIFNGEDLFLTIKSTFFT